MRKWKSDRKEEKRKLKKNHEQIRRVYHFPEFFIEIFQQKSYPNLGKRFFKPIKNQVEYIEKTFIKV